MVETVTCESCDQPFKLTPHHIDVIQRARAKTMTFVLLKCPNCRLPTGFDIEQPTPESVVCRCPVSHCTGWVCYVDDPKRKDPPFWGCGECGAVWYDRANLLKEVAAIAKRFKHRRGVYKKVKGEWTCVALDDEPADYEERVEREPWDNADDCVRG